MNEVQWAHEYCWVRTDGFVVCSCCANSFLFGACTFKPVVAAHLYEREGQAYCSNCSLNFRTGKIWNKNNLVLTCCDQSVRDENSLLGFHGHGDGNVILI